MKNFGVGDRLSIDRRDWMPAEFINPSNRRRRIAATRRRATGVRQEFEQGLVRARIIRIHAIGNIPDRSLSIQRTLHLSKSNTREVRSCAELQAVCLQTLKQCQGFEQVNEVLVQPRENAEGFANWTLAAVRPRVENRFLRAAGGAIAVLQQTYQLNAETAPPPPRQRR